MPCNGAEVDTEQSCDLRHDNKNQLCPLNALCLRIVACRFRCRTFVEEHNGTIRGFAELEDNGHIGAIHVHVDCQGLGIASALLDEIEKEAVARGIPSLSTEASITAQPFFAKRGFETVAAQDVEYGGQIFRNYRMRKQT